MQPPPTAASVGAGGPPPLATSQNMYWRNGPFGRRANAQVSQAAGPVQPVTDPFAFGRQMPPLGAPKGGLPVSQGFSPPVVSHPHPQALDNPHGLLPSSSAPVSQSGANSTLSNLAAPFLSLSAHVTNNNSAGMPCAAEQVHMHNPPGQSYSAGIALENSVSGHEGLASGPDRLQGVHRNPSDPSLVPATLPVFPPPRQTVPQWKPAQGSVQPQGQPYLPYPEPPAQNASYAVTQPAVGVFQPGPHQSPPQQTVVQNPTQAPLMTGDSPSMADPQSTFHNAAWQNTGATNPWQGPFPQEHFYLQPLGTTYGLGHPTTQENNPTAPPQATSEAVSGQYPAEADSGTISMFFKGDEAENEEILSSGECGQVGRADLDPFQQSVGHTYYQPLNALQVPAATFSEGQVNTLPPAETQQKGGGVRQPSRTACGAHDIQTHKNPALHCEDRAADGLVGPQYENVENLECVQNQEVLPSELSAHNSLPSTAVSESYRGAPLSGLSLPKDSSASHVEGGPNLEAPEWLPQPVRPDSVSSNYSCLSHRSASGSARPQEQGTFIQQESGRPEEDSSARFFKQVDSSPLGLPSEPNLSKNYHSGLSQALTPSPPKPMGVFQTSINSSFEPVRSHGLGPKPTEVDRAKVVGELRENHAHRRSAKKSPAVPVASPGNLEQPPDNLETIFMPQAHPLPLTVASSSGPLLENVPSIPEKRPSARAQGAIKQCESPATTLWASNELPDFGGNVLLAPAAPAVYVPARQTVQVVQPPDEGLLPHQQPSKLCSVLLPPPAGNASSENLENPPKVGDEEALCSQASSGYASLLSSPPTEALQNQPILIAQPNQSSPAAQPVHFPLANQVNKNDSGHLAKDPGVGSHPLLGMPSGNTPSRENVLLPAAQPGSLLPTTVAAVTSSAVPQASSANLLVQPAAQLPLNLAPEGAKVASSEFAGQPGAVASGSQSNMGTAPAPPAGSTAPTSTHCRLKESSKIQEPSGALDFTVAKTSEQSGSQAHNQQFSSSLGFPPSAHPAAGKVEPEVHNQQRFYRQVTQETWPTEQSDRGTPLRQQPAVPLPPPPTVPLNQQGPPEGSPAPAPSQPPVGYSQAASDNKPLSLGHPVSAPGTTSLPSAPAPASISSHPSGASSQQEPQHSQASQVPPNAFGLPPNPYAYYYKTPYPYGLYQSPYQPPYPPPPLGPQAAHLYYQEDAYGRYDPRYSQYDSSAAYVNPGDYRYVEPERPSSRASHTSDRPSSRQGYPEDYYGAKSGWAEYYAAYYANQHDYGDPSRNDRYSSAYAARFRDPRGYDPQYWYDADQNPYQKREAYGSSHPQYDPWQYDPRSTGSFDDDLEPRRDPYGDDFDRRSVHSEHSGHSLRSSQSLRSRQSSFSSRSQQSQLYRSNHDLTAGTYDVTHQPASLQMEYSYGEYTNYDSQPPFTDYSYSANGAWPAAEQVPSRPLTPEKFSVPHVCARFGPGGYLIKVLANLPSEGQPALVELHSMEVMMQHSPEQEEMRAFPGPLTKDDTHKVDVINFAQNKATRCSQNDALIDKESARLLWDFVVLLCRQNGTVVGTDIAELLLQDHKTVWLPGKSPNEANLIDFTNEALEQVEESGEAQLSFLTESFLPSADSLEKETERFRELLLYGRKKDALESAMKHGLWGHALLLASKMDSRTHARVMTRFANSLPINDPLQTVYQLMSGRMPAASTCCGDEKWGDWRPHLAMVLSNVTNGMEVELRTITTMGDTLASKGLLDAAHFCYLMAQVGFGVYTKKSAKLVLIGSNHSLPFAKFATNEAIRRTEAYEYAQSLGNQPCALPNFQVFKFIYACRLAEVGLAAQAFHYCEVICRTILQNPFCYSPVLIGQLIQMSSQLRLFDPQLKEKPEQELFIEPNWLIQLRNLDGQIKEGSVAYNTGRSSPQQYVCSTPSSELEHIGQNDGMGTGQEMNSGTDNPLLAPLLPMQSVQLMPSAPPTILNSSTAMLPSSQPEPAGGTVPFYPVAPSSMGPGPGFPYPPGAEQAPVYLGAAVAPAGLPTQPNELQPQEQISQEAGGAPQDSPGWKAVPEAQEEDFYGKMASMGYGQRSRTTSESSVHSVGRERQTLAAKQPSPPPPAIPEGKETKKAARKEQVPRKSGASWFDWLRRRGKSEAHLPDDKNKSIVWDGQKQRWVNLDEPEEESKPPPPPPMGFPQVPQAAASSGSGAPPAAPVNMFSRRAAGSRARYVDILNPSGTKSPEAVPAPSELFAPLAPMPIPANLLVPNSVAEEQQPLEGKVAEDQVAPGNQPVPETAAELPPNLNSAKFPPGSEFPPSNPDGSQSGELSRSSSMSSLSREVSQHFHQLSSEGPPAGTVQFYNPSQFAQHAAAPGSTRLGRIGQRKYPTLK
ncbi:protein transport protein Sec16A isoform X2 [Tiliqua scincoides]|uniref:protein transport protein Sec16A isoform X2 n=1 Tax=Tiliqua scincoides TaxID=71010 RepID=UPI003461CF2F